MIDISYMVYPIDTWFNKKVSIDEILELLEWHEDPDGTNELSVDKVKEVRKLLKKEGKTKDSFDDMKEFVSWLRTTLGETL